MLDVIRKKPKNQNMLSAEREEEQQLDGQGGGPVNLQASVMPRESGVANVNGSYPVGIQGGNAGTTMAMQQAPAAFQY